MGAAITKPSYAEHRVRSCESLVPFVDHWRTLAEKRYKQYRAWQKKMASFQVLPPHNAGWECIHSKEGSWSDPNAPYYGGLQMSESWGSSRNRARLHLGGTANNWSALQQKWLAELEYRDHHYSSAWMSGQWPNTYPPCAGHF